jgi:uncharacterized protein (TIGR02147 family)
LTKGTLEENKRLALTSPFAPRFDVANRVGASDTFSMVEISGYLNFREFLKDFYNFKKQESKSFSYAVFAKRAGLKSPNYLKLVIDGDRKLSEDLIPSFSKGLGLKKEHEAEFRLMVQMNQAADPVKRQNSLQSLVALRTKSQLKREKLNFSFWSQIPTWIAWTIYEMADQKGANFTPEFIKNILRFPASIEDVKKALSSLLERGELRLKDGLIEKARDILETPEDVPVNVVKSLMRDFILLSVESLYRDRPDEREFGGFTLSLTKEEFTELKNELRDIRLRLIERFTIARKSSKGDRIYQLNIQFFPLTDEVKGLNNS